MYGMRRKADYYHDYNDDIDEYNPLLLDIQEDNLKSSEAQLNKDDVKEGTSWPKIMLHIASRRGYAQVAETLIKNGDNVNARDFENQTPLLVALAKNHIEVANILLQNGANVNVADYKGKTPLHLATELKNIHLVETILEKGAKVNVVDEDLHMTPIQIAAKVNDIQIVEMFLKHGAKMDPIVEVYGGRKHRISTTTPLHYAAKNGNLEMFELLLKNGFDALDTKNEDDETPLCLAVINNRLNVVKYLIENGSKIVPENKYDICLLHLCGSNENIEVLQYLLDLGLKCEHYSGKSSLLYFSLFDCQHELWKYLLTSTSKIDALLCSHETEFHSAIRDGQIEIVREILNKQTRKVNLDSLFKKLAIFIAVENRNEEILKILLEAGYSGNHCFHKELRPLHTAATFEDSRLVEILLKAGADINSKTEYNITPLIFAAAAGSANNVKFLLDAGANVRRFVSSALEYALKRRPCNEDEANLTPLMFQNLLKITEMLLIAGIGKVKKSHYYDNLLNYAINLRVSNESKQISSSFHLKDESNVDDENKGKNTKKGEFRPEIVRCLINYLKEDTLNDSLNSFISISSELFTPEIMNVILEYYDSKSDIYISHLYRNYWSNLCLIGQSENVKNLLDVIETHILTKQTYKNEWADLFKMIVARLEFLPSDQKTNKEDFYFYDHLSLFFWQTECQHQLKSMRITKLVDELNVTYYDILSKPVDKVASYIRDEKLLISLESSYEKFSAYAKFLEMRVGNAKQRNDLKDTCMNSMFYFIKKNHKIECSSQDIEEILQYLAVFDLRRLSAAFSSFFSL